MARGWRWLRRVVGTALLLAGLALAFYAFVLTGLVESAARQALEELGLGPARIEVRAVTLTGAEIGSVALGEGGRLGAVHLSVRYSLKDLLHRRVDTVQISGAHFEVRLDGGVVDLGPLARLPRRQQEGPAELPFRKIALDDARIDVVLDGRPVTLRATGSIAVTSGTHLDATFDAAVLGADVHVEGWLDPGAGVADLQLTVSVPSVGHLVAILPESMTSAFGRWSGPARVEARLGRRDGSFAAAGRLEAPSLAWSGAVGEDRIIVPDCGLDLVAPSSTTAPAALGTSFKGRLWARGALMGGLGPFDADLDLEATSRDRIEVTAVLAAAGRSSDRIDVAATVTDPFGDPRASGTVAVELPAGVPEALATRFARWGVSVAPAARVRADASFAASMKTAGRQWEATLTDGRLDARIPEIRLVGATVSDAFVHASFAGRASTAGARLQVAEGAVVRIQGASGPAAGGWRAACPSSPGAGVMLAKPLEISLGFGDDPGTWRVQGDGLVLDLGGATVALDGPNAAVSALAASLPGALDAGPEGLRVRLESGGLLTVDGPLRIPSLGVLANDGTGPLAVLTLAAPATMVLGAGIECGAPSMTLELAGDPLTVGAFGTASAFKAQFRSVAAAVDARQVRLTLGEPGTVAFGALRNLPGTTGVTIGPGRLAIEPPPGGGLLVWDAGGPAGGFGLTSAQPLALALEDVATGTVADLRIDAALTTVNGATGGEAQVRARLDAAHRSGPGAPALDVAARHVDVTLQAKTAPDAPGGITAMAELRLGEDGEVRAKQVDAEVVVSALDVQATATFGPGGLEATGEMVIGRAEAWYGPARLTVSDVAATIPLAWGRPAAEPGRFAVDTIWWGDDLLPPLTGTLSFGDGRTRVSVDWPVLKGVVAHGQAWFDVLRRVPEGEIGLIVPRFEITRENQPADLLSWLRGARMGGAMALDAGIRVVGPRVEPRVALTLEDVSFESSAWDASAKGVNATVVVVGFAPLATPGGQRITVEQGHLGKLEVVDGRLDVRLEGADSLFIEQTSWGWAGGRLSLHALRFDPGRPVIDGVIYAENLDLGRLLEVIAPDEAQGTGSLYGRLPVRVDWPQISYGDGFLYAAPGVNTLQVLEAGALLDKVPERAREALRNLEYSVLKAEFTAREKGGDARVRLRGRSADPALPQEVVLDLNLNGFDRLLDAAIIINRSGAGLIK